MRSTNNRFIIASAGSGKTTCLVEEALSHPDREIIVLTYTNNNLCEIKKKFYEKHGVIPSHVSLTSWYTFLLHECARPYQRSVYSKRRVKTIHFPEGRSAKGALYSDIERYYFLHGDEIYADKISRFVIDCERNSKGLVTKRLASIFDEILIDEFQDLSGYDLDLLEVFLQAGLNMVIVGDPRQCTYTTNNSSKNSQYRGIGILELVRKWEQNTMCKIESLARNYRCNQIICDYADMLWPNMEKTISYNTNTTKHDGIYIISTDKIHDYIRDFSPTILRYNRTAKTYGYHALNFGSAKGLEFDRVLIIPHGPIKKYLQSGNANDIMGSLEKFYVAVTRAKQSVAFLYDGHCSSHYIKWTH